MKKVAMVLTIIVLAVLAVLTSALEISWKMWCLQHWYIFIGIIAGLFLICTVVKFVQNCLQK